MRYQVHTAETAPARSKPYLQGAERSFGFLPNLLGVLAESPAALEAYLSLGKILEKSSLTPMERQVVLLAISRENQCDYCMAAHSTIATAQDVPEDVLRSLREGTPIADPRLESLRFFTTAVIRHRGFVPEAEVLAFLDAGYTRAQILEVITAAAMKTLSNYGNHLADTPLDDAFKAQEWSLQTAGA